MKQIKEVATEIGCVKLISENDKIIGLHLPRNPRLFRNMYEYTYKSLLNLPFNIDSGTKFQKKIWKYLTKIPYGKTVSYKKIAKDLNLGKAYRAIGSACKKNTIPIIIPCHRVINANGDLGKFSQGAKWKKFLINLENNRI